MENILSKVNTDYGNLISAFKMKILFSISVMAMILAGASFYITKDILILFLGTLLFLVLLGYSIYMQICRNRLSFTGGCLIEKLHKYLVDHLFWNGKGSLLDIGCKSGALTIRCAKRYDNANITGVDSWGKKWEYGKNQCETNATLNDVGLRTQFQHEDLSHLTFADESFDAVASSLSFYKTPSVKDKKQLLKESLRVLKKGGSFAFHDKFAYKKYYANLDEFIEELKKEGITEIHYMHKMEKVCGFMPYFICAPWILGGTGILYGVK